MRKHFIFTILTVGSMVFPYCSFSEVPSTVEMRKLNTNNLIPLIRHHDWRVRYNAIVYGLSQFRKIKVDGRAHEFKRFEGYEQIRAALIDLLKKELLFAKDEKTFGDQGEGEGYGGYLLELLAAVCGLKDKEALPVLVETIGGGIGRGPAVIRTLAEFGDTAVEPIIAKLHDNENPNRTGAAHVLEQMLRMKSQDEVKLSTTSIKRVKGVLKETLRGQSSPWTKRHSVKALGYIKDEDIVPFLKSISEKDPYMRVIDASFRGGKTGKKMRIYPVREEAEKVLKRIKTEKLGNKEQQKN